MPQGGDESAAERLIRRYREAIARTDALIDPAPAYGKTPAEVRARAEIRLARLRSFLAHLGSPHDRYPIIHVGGTSGKGSTSTAIAAILTAAGYRTGLHTSPFLQVATEKLAVDGRLIAGDVFADLVEEILAAAETWNPTPEGRLTYGEVWVALLATFFARAQVDVAVIEVGAGGRFDLTNVVRPSVSVITSVGIDHTETLGATIPEIAWHKAGIIKAGAPTVTAVTDPKALEPILAEAQAAGSSVSRPVAGVDFVPVAFEDGSDSVQFSSGKQFRLGMSGKYQAANAALAVTAVEALAPSGFTVPDDAIQTGLATARLPGRFETVQRTPRVVLDGAHNLQKIAALVDDLPVLLPRPSGGRLIVVLGVLEAKDHTGIVGRIAAHADELVVTRPRVLAKPGADPAAIAEDARRAGFSGPVPIEDEPTAAIETAIARANAERGDAVLVTGSLYLVGNVRGRWYPDDAITVQQTAWPTPTLEHGMRGSQVHRTR
ncbi:MAG: dihydrofolate synthase / folylpolyglutamate synthase [Thermomicrobiales bacterium]|nr:dihydrofolate synthase / folylpolyglutamate synthase [Thermomicrobiales bacterium]